jgi:transposase
MEQSSSFSFLCFPFLSLRWEWFAHTVPEPRRTAYRGETALRIFCLSSDRRPVCEAPFGGGQKVIYAIAFIPTVAAALGGAGLPLAVVNPHQIRDFVRATGQLAKTDALDARIIASFAERTRPKPRPIADADSQTLAELVARRRQVVEMIGMETNRLRQARHARVQRTIRVTLKTLEAQLAALDRDIDDAVRGSPIWRAADDLLPSVPGTGEVASRTLIADLPELGHIDRRRIAALVGLAPINRDSGQMRGRRTIAGGRTKVRSTLYMATLSASRWNPVISRHYKAPIERRLKKKVALVACMRRLLGILNAILRTRTPRQSA